MARTSTKLILLAALVATAGCASKRPKILPPGGGDAVVGDPNGGGGGNGQGGAIIPGSAEDFRRSAVSDTIHFALDQYDIDATSRSRRASRPTASGSSIRCRLRAMPTCSRSPPPAAPRSG